MSTLAHFVHLIIFLLACFKNPALVPANSESRVLGKPSEMPLSLKRKQQLAQKQNTGWIWKHLNATAADQIKLIIKEQGRALGAITGRTPCTGREATAAF